MDANYTTQPLQEEQKNLDSIHRESVRIYTGAFRTSPAEALNVEANDPSLELRRNELGLRFLDKLKSNS